MSERDDELAGKVRQLFPVRGSGGDERAEDEETGEQGGASEKEPAGLEEESLEEVDNVVRLPFGRPEPVTSVAESVEVPVDPQAGAKLALFTRLIDEGMVMVILDPRVEGVQVPPQFYGQPELRLNFSHDFHLVDFDYDVQGVRGSLSFQGKRFFCNIPWVAIHMLYAHESGEGYVFEPRGMGPEH
ncbi:ClpXP protease specificity-enhancing factor SspB [Lujinxingia litoralis]|nr:ClpXP protease specificity-enhancing factor SspB [Lujinxingia litoralis]